jgi:hypothetical protein
MVGRFFPTTPRVRRSLLASKGSLKVEIEQ